jgi:hypothetical protein
MPSLTTAALSTEVLEGALLTLEQITTRITVHVLNAPRNPEQSARVRALMSDLLADIQDCEEQLRIYAPSGCLKPPQIDTQPLRRYLCCCSFFQIRSSDLRNSPPLCGRARLRLQKTLPIHQT